MRTVYFEDMQLGQQASYTRTLTDADVVLYAGITGDNNPIHLNADYAASTRFGGRICHGMMTAGFISTVLGTELPGVGTIYVSQQVRFKAPVRVGDTLSAVVTITALDPVKHRVTFQTQCLVAGQVVVDGEAVVIAPSRPTASA